MIFGLLEKMSFSGPDPLHRVAGAAAAWWSGSAAAVAVAAVEAIVK